MLERLRAKDKQQRVSRPAKKPSRPAEDGFWHQPALLNLCADMLIIAASIVLAWAAVIAAQRLPFYPLREVKVTGELSQVQRDQLESAARSTVHGNFFTVDIDATRDAFESLPWVRRADIRRQWPDTLVLHIEEQVPVARWRGVDDTPKLVNTYGEVFAGSVDLPLPLFSGPEGTSAEVLARYKEFDKALAPLAMHPMVVALSPREAWQLRLDSGLLVDLGRDQNRLPLTARVERFVASWPDVVKRVPAQIVAVDMRYPNGFTLRTGRGDNKSQS